MTVTYAAYEEEKMNFFKKQILKNDNGYKTYTSPMENNCYHKEYCWENGAQWCEVTDLITDEVEVETHGIKTTVQVKFWRTEFYSTETASKYFYEIAK